MSATRPRARRRLALVCAIVVMVASFGLIAPSPAAPGGPLTQQVAGCAGSSMRAGATVIRTVKVSGVVRTFRIHVPLGYSGRQPVPLVLAYHGHAERVAPFESYTGLSTLPAIVVYPTGLRGTDNRFAWQGAPYASPRADDLAFTQALLRDLHARACVDRSRTYAIGRSNGGGFVAMLACRMPSGFAGFATVNAAVYLEAVAGCPRQGPAISLIDFHGTADRTISYAGGRRFGERYLSTPEWLHRWVARDGCVDAPITVPVNLAVDRMSWLCTRAGAAIVHYRIRGGTHAWPAPGGTSILGSAGSAGSTGGTVNATDLIWRFFLTHPRLGSS